MILTRKSFFASYFLIVSLLANGLFISIVFTNEAIGSQINWTEEYNCNEIPQLAEHPWSAYHRGTSYSGTIDDGILDISTINAYLYYARKNVLLQNNRFVPATVEFKMRVVYNTVDFTLRRSAMVTFGAGGMVAMLRIYPDKVILQTSPYWVECVIPMDTTDDFHVYRLLVADKKLDLYIDNVCIISSATGSIWSDEVGPWGSTIGTIAFGDTSFKSDNADPLESSKSEWDFIRFYVGEVIPPEQNTPPVADAGGPYLVAVDESISLDSSGSYDPDGDPLTYYWTQDEGLGIFTMETDENPAYSGAQAGITDLTLTVSDGIANDSNSTMVVVYNPSAGFVTGGGWIISPEGALIVSEATGKANFGFVAKYKKGANIPEGNTEFRFKAGNFAFKSSSYDWLVVAGKKAMFKGEGTIEGLEEETFKFMLTAIDDDEDKFRIKIWDELTDLVIYDNKRGESDDAEPTVIGGGSIVIHNK